MGTIGSTLGYYQLSNLLSSGSGSSSSLNSSSATSLQSLEQAFEASESSSSGNSYLLDLSPEAQNLLNSSSGSGTSATSTTFTLTAAQQTQITDILDKYKDAPLTQATFNDIQNALEAAGLAPQTLGAEDQVKSFNPTNVLIQALGGNYSNVQAPTSAASNEQTKESNYMQSIVSLWKSIDTGNSSASGTSSTSTASSAAGASL